MDAQTKTRAPSAWELETAMSIAMATINGLVADEVDTDETELRALLADMDADVEGLLLRLLRAAAEADANMEAVAARIGSLVDRKTRFSNQKDAYRNAAQAIIEALPAVFPGGKYTHPEYTATVRAGLARPILTGVAELPDEYWRITRAPDMVAIKAALKTGSNVPGVEVSNGASVLTVRAR